MPAVACTCPDLLNKKSEEPGMTSLNKPVSTIYLAVASAFVLAPPAQAETRRSLARLTCRVRRKPRPIPRPSVAGTKTDTPLMETPVSIQVVSRQ
jgi:outer membrane receptor protein involved in Fe transport